MNERGAWAFPPHIDPWGGVATLSLEDSLRQSLRLILATARGERVMRPSYGLGIQDYGFEVINVATLDMMRSSVREGLLACEPRLEHVEVSIATDALDEGVLLVVIHYRAAGGAQSEELTHAFPVTG